MEISPAVMDRIAAQYQQSFTRIQNAAELAAQDAWFTHNSFEGAEDEDWEAAFWLILAAAGLATAALTTAYFQTQLDYLGIAPRFATPNISDELREEFDRYGSSPATRARFLISEGLDPDEAMAESVTRISKLTDVATRDAEQRVLGELMDQISVETTWEFVDLDRPDQIFHPGDSGDVDQLVTTLSPPYRMNKRGKGHLKWKRVPQMRACGWCQAMAGRLLTDETKERGEGWHISCRCGWRQVTPAEAAAYEPISSQEFKALLPIRSEPDEDSDLGGQGT